MTHFLNSHGAARRPSWFARLMRRIGWMVGAQALLLVMLAGCTNSGGARETLEGAGYTRITLGGYDWFTCGNDDSTCTEFEATGPSGVRVKGAVGCAYFAKGCTIRQTGVVAGPAEAMP